MNENKDFTEQESKTDLQDPDVAFLNAKVKAGLSWVVPLVDIGTQTDEVFHHQVVV